MTRDDTRFSSLLDAEARHRGDPDSFSIPRSDVRSALAPGDGVKLLFGAGPGDPPPEQFAIVSDEVWHAGARPTRAVRTPAPDASFSGWVVYGPSDPSAPARDLHGFGPVSHQALTDRYRSFDSIEDEVAPSAWRWDPHELEWQREAAVPDSSPQ